MSPLMGSDKYRVQPPARKLTWKQQVIEKAKKEIRIEDVLSRYYGLKVPYDAMNWKVRCPYAYEHADAGLDKQFRVYSDSNTGWCFDMHGRIDNLRLYADKHPHMDYFALAKSLLDEYGIEYRQKSYQEKFEEIKQESNAMTRYEDLVDAMKFYLSDMTNYEDHEYDLGVVERINAFNSQAKFMVQQNKSLEEIQEWYQQQKTSMRMFLLSLDS